MQQHEDIHQYFLAPYSNTWKDRMFCLAVRCALHLPGISSMLLHNVDIMCRYLNFLLQNNEIQAVYRLVLACLETTHYQQPKYADTWWFFMRVAIATLQQEQLQLFKIYPQFEDRLMQLAETSTQPKTGYNASYVFVGFALWSFERGLVKKSISLAKTAETAYDHWGYPDYLVGWFNLFNNPNESLTYFCKAVTKDWSMLHRIRHDPTCLMFPEIVKQVSHKVFVSDMAQERKKFQ
jgi:hypothetical protein